VVGHSQPAACDPIFAELYARDAISADQVWKRVTLLLENGHDQLAAHFRQRLDPARQDWLEYWLASHRQPRQTLERPDFPLIGSFAAQVIIHALQRVAAEEPAAALDYLRHYQQQE